jgi:hypothetical protein
MRSLVALVGVTAALTLPAAAFAGGPNGTVALVCDTGLVVTADAHAAAGFGVSVEATATAQDVLASTCTVE